MAALPACFARLPIDVFISTLPNAPQRSLFLRGVLRGFVPFFRAFQPAPPAGLTNIQPIRPLCALKPEKRWGWGDVKYGPKSTSKQMCQLDDTSVPLKTIGWSQGADAFGINLRRWSVKCWHQRGADDPLYWYRAQAEDAF